VAGQKLPGSLEGIVLTSSIVAPSEQFSVPRQNLGEITVPVLLIQHQKDACRLCIPSLLPNVLQLFASCPVKKLILATGGSNPRGDLCGALHWHGFIGMESEAVGLICNWINSPEA
jgi:pimeloyl-ACP methyl ester carboxylesterase